MLKSTTARLALVMCGAAMSACAPPVVAPPQPAPQTVTPPPKASDALVLADGAEALDLSPIPAPGERLFHMRWAQPGKTLATMAGFTTVPRNVVDSATSKMLQEFTSEMLRDDVDVQKFAELISLDAPFELVSVVGESVDGEPEFMFATSIGLTSLVRARAAARGRARKVSAGVWRLGPSPEFGGSCVVAASAGATPARLICGEEDKHVLGLARYMATTLALEPSHDADVHADLTLRPPLRRLSKDLKEALAEARKEMDHFSAEFPLIAPSATKIVNALGQELLAISEDADGVSFAVKFDATRGIEASAQARFTGQRSWMVGSMLDGADTADVAPEMFWHLPKDSNVATYGRAADPSRYDDILKVTRDVAMLAMKEAKFASPADRKAIAKLLRLPVSKHTSVVSASGHFAGATPASIGAVNNDPQALISDGLGWYLYGVDEGPTKMRAYMQELVRVYNRPTLQRLAKKALRADASLMPTVRQVAAPRGLGRGGMAIELTVKQVEEQPVVGMAQPSGPQPARRPTPKPKAKPKVTTFTAHVMMAVHGKRTWLGMAMNKAELLKVMSGLKTAGPNSLKARSGLDAFRNEKHAVGSFTHVAGMTGSLRPFAELYLAVGPGNTSKQGQRVLDAFNKMPNRGTTPIQSFVDVQAGAAPTTTVKFHVLPKSMEDVGFLLSEIASALEAP